MGTCDFCGSEYSPLYSCNHCGQEHCSDCRLPENHNCPMFVPGDGGGRLGSDAPTTQNKKTSNLTDRRESGTSDRPESTEPMGTTGTTPSGPSAPSPDVNPDGSLAGGESSSTQSGARSAGATARRTWHRLAGGVRRLLAALWRPKAYLVLALAVVIFAGTIGTGFAPLDNPAEDLVEGGQNVGDDAVGGAASAVDSVGTDPDDINETAVARAAHERINEARAESGLSRLSWDPALYTIARDHSETMAETGTLAHEIGGADHADRYTAAGYSCDGLSGENIHRTYAATDIETDRGTVNYDGNETRLGRGIARAWLNSPDHRENILQPEFTWEAIGITAAENGSKVQVYATQNFC